MVIYYIEHVYLRPYVYYFCQILQALRLFPALRLFGRLEYIGYVVKLPSTFINFTRLTTTFSKELRVPAAGNDKLVDVFKKGRTV